MSALEELVGLTRDLTNPAVQDWKAKKRKIVGHFCSYVPEEMLYAANVLPYRVRAPHCAETTLADVYMSHFNCSFVRSCLQFVYEGKYNFLDGFVFTNSCDHTRRLYDVMRETGVGKPFMHFLSVPHKVSVQSVAYYRDEISKFKENIENSFGVEISEKNLKEAIQVYNETRHLLRRLYELRQEKAPPLTGEESLSILLAGTAIPRDQYNELLKRLLEELSRKKGISDYKARLMIAGGGCDNPDYYGAMEELGGLIVTDSLCFGSRYFWEPVELGDDLLLSLAKAYLSRPSCANMADKVAERSEFVKEMAERSKADGVVFQRMRYCDLWGGQLLHLENRLKEANIPLLALEREYRLDDVGRLRTRVQAFLERIGR